MDAVEIIETSFLDLVRIQELLFQSLSEGYNHINRFAMEYSNGTNGFNKPGESLFIAFIEDHIIGICGLNIDPYLDGNVGRVRRLYVLPNYRMKGIGRRLIEEVIHKARESFKTLVLKTDSDNAKSFYNSLGFKEIKDDPSITHLLKLQESVGD
jgi:N-acetylglutamate synthase-like GNAT family acetyltransferase